MAWEIEYTTDFGRWFDALAPEVQDAVAVKVGLLEAVGVALDYPHSSRIATSRYGNMRELRIQHGGHPYRVLYAFDPRRIGVLLLGGDKTGDDRWYQHIVPIADGLYALHLTALRRNGEI